METCAKIIQSRHRVGVLIPEGIKLTIKVQELKLCGNRAESITLEQIIKVTRRYGRTVGIWWDTW